MIYINGDILRCIAYKTKTKPPRKYKGEVYNNLLILEDFIDFSKKSNSGRHKCICKCLRCGRVFLKIVEYRYLKNGSIKCCCDKHDNRFKYFWGKSRMLKFLEAERNMAKQEAFFEEDEERVKNFTDVIGFIKSDSLKDYFKEKLDMGEGIWYNMNERRASR